MQAFTTRNKSVRGRHNGQSYPFNYADKNKAEAMLELGTLHFPLEERTANVQHHGINTIRALADMLNCNITKLPFIVGIFTDSNKDDHLSKLTDELHKMGNINQHPDLQFSPLLFLFPLVVSVSVGYVFGMLTNWQVGLSIGNVGMFIQITLLVFIITGSKFFKHPRAITASISIARFILWLQLLLNVAFCYSRKPLDNHAPVRTIVVYHRLHPNCSPEIALFSMIEKMWSALIERYGQLPIRFQQSFQPPAGSERRFKRLFCIPAFLVVIAFWIAVIVTTGILRYNSGDIMMIFHHGAVSVAFVTMCTVIFLSLFGSIPSLWRLIKGLSVNPIKSIRGALSHYMCEELGSYEKQHLMKNEKHWINQSIEKIHDVIKSANSGSLKNLAICPVEDKAQKADFEIREDFAKICKILASFDGLEQRNQTRFVICLEGIEIMQRDVLAKLIYQLHNLILCEFTASVAMVIEANFKLLLGETAANLICETEPDPVLLKQSTLLKTIPQVLSDNLHLIQTSVHLPIYLDIPVYPECEFEHMYKWSTSPVSQPNGYFSKQSHENMISSMLSPGMLSPIKPNLLPDKQTPERKHSAGIIADSKKLGSVSRSSSNVSRLLEMHQGMAVLFLEDHELSDWNRKVIKQLVLATAFTSRLLRLSNIEVQLEDIIFWLTLVQYWPFHTAWMILLLEVHFCEQTGELGTKKLNLVECLTQVKHHVSKYAGLFGPLITDDRDLERLANYLQSRPNLTIHTVKKLISCVLMHNPLIRNCIILLTTLNGEKIFKRKSFLEIYRKKDNAADGEVNRGINDEGEYQDFYYNGKKPAFSNKYQRETYLKSIAELDETDICELLMQIPHMTVDRLRHYQSRIKKHKITGSYLMKHKPETLQKTLLMNSNDWHYFSWLLTPFFPKVIDSSNHNQVEQAFIIENEMAARHSIPSLKPAKVRQTPWLLSPQVSTGPIASEFVTTSLIDPLLVQTVQTDQQDTQTSQSGMEEPESLWTAPVPIKRSLVDSRSHPSHLDTAYFNYDGPMKKVDTQKPIIRTTRPHLNEEQDMRAFGVHPNENYSHILENDPSNVFPLNTAAREFIKSSRSTADLQCFAPYRSELFEAEICNKFNQHVENDLDSLVIRNDRYRKASDFSKAERKTECPKKRSKFDNTNEMLFIQNPYTVPYNQNGEINSWEEDITDLRKLRKRPCLQKRRTRDPGRLSRGAQTFHVGSTETHSAKLTCDKVQDIKDKRIKQIRNRTNEFTRYPVNLADVILKHNMRKNSAPTSNMQATVIDNSEIIDLDQLYNTVQRSPIRGTALTDKQMKRSVYSIGNWLNTADPAESTFYHGSDQCNCHYWYGLETRYGARMTVSEPTLRDQLEDLSTSTPSPEELVMLTKECSDDEEFSVNNHMG